MIKIAHIQLLPLLSGVQRVCLDELTRLDDNKFDKYLICKEEGPLTTEAKKYGIKCLVVKNLVRELSLKNDLKALWSLWKIIKKHNFDIVHTHSSKTGVLGRVAAYLNRTSLIVHTVHGFSFPIAKNKLQRILFWLMEKIGSICGDIIICLHEDDARIARSILKISEHKICIISNGVDIEKFKPYDKSRKLLCRENIIGINSDDIIIGMIGRLWPQKNPICLLHAVSEIIKSNKQVKCFFIGDGELYEQMAYFIKLNDLSDNIKLFGWRNDTYIFLNAMDIFVLPSLWEGMPIAILEAKSSGLPCVVSNIQGNRSIIDGVEDGLLFDLGLGWYDLYEKLQILIGDPQLRYDIGKKARLSVINHYNIASRIQRIENIYLEKIK
ncbi:glycosyltransferase family 4 protein [Salmonella enterica]|nr:glycosyltransferase family 1 protein [Salmonella enterica]EDU4939758.1 glycosyltransferase family 4 protein [Salmonella enterica subsp. arizonae]EAU7889847.1 glycosyltransferase family 1 protein [Salmonella enterica]EBC0628553.1 glycosyltransferase family 4 protein [Salmonella enterica]EDE9522257.1 glycosyltransferase [Salmonella enterica]